MNPLTDLWGQAVGVITLLLMLSFIGMWIWAWLPGHRSAFDALSKLPMEDDGNAEGSR